MKTRFLIGLATAWIAGGIAVAQAPAPTTPPAPNPDNMLNLDLSTGGRVTIELRPDKAPLAVERIKLLTRRGFYDGLTFHRVIAGFMAQGGDPKGDGSGGSELPNLKAEFNDLPHLRGSVAMARAQSPDSANSQFYIVLSPTFGLDMKYTVVGRVTAGMGWVDKLEVGEPPAHPSKILHASIGDAPPYVPTAAVTDPVPTGIALPTVSTPAAKPAVKPKAKKK